jgi:hypothetical protein
MAMLRIGPGSPFAVATKPVANTTADLSGDGHLDLLVANVAQQHRLGAAGRWPRRLHAGRAGPGNGPGDVEAGDLNGEGPPEFIVSDPGNSTVSVLLNNGSGGFVAAAPGAVPQEAAKCKPPSRSRTDQKADGS